MKIRIASSKTKQNLKIAGILKVRLIGALKIPIDLRALAPWWEQKVRKRWGGHSNLGITSHV